MSSPQQNPNAVDVTQASELTGLSKKALRRRVERGTLDSIKVGGKRLIPISELEGHDLLVSSEPTEPAASPSVSRTAEPPQGGGEAPERPVAAPAGQAPRPPAPTPPPTEIEREPSAPITEPSTPVEPEPTQPSAEASAPTGEPMPAATPSAGPAVEIGSQQSRPASPAAANASGPQPTSPVPAPAVSASAPTPGVAQMGATAPAAPGYPPGQFVPVQAGPEYAYPVDAGPWRYWYQSRALRWLTILLLLALIGLIVWLLFFRSSHDTATIQPGGGPVGVTQEDLIALSQQLHAPIYWAGTMPGTRMELTETDNSYAYIRYLGEDTPIGDTSANFLTVGTYPQSSAFRNLKAYAKHSRAKTERIQKGGVAVVIPGSPTSVYFAYPHEDVQVEVYDPQPQRALDLVKSGVVRPVIASTSTAGAAGTGTVPTTTPATPSELPTVPQG